ncbi:ATP-binding cassette domain-containing protein [Luteolibacter sp. SL250]|uniref:ATP-binding cassette domain-containing protein n=1 Tax=Luteolibacter sp. SL250 TaxID=2995170 RepID=UPI00226FEAD2|nr:ATP-binding cassette domain-containing protein [Luteolibacter sp. SL250]WAC21574.1 ATP-binding cassette domain-containing protein [Luteolibacter sp. SL250]
MKIGYGSPIAGLEKSIELGGGTHFILARNGRGKTTLLRTIARTLRPVEGSLKTDGALQYLPEDLRFDQDMTAGMILRSLVPKNRLKEALALAERIELNLKRPYGRLSTGNRRKINLIMAEFSIHPDTGNILLLDEPFSGLDAFARQAFEEIWRASSDNVLRLVSCHPDYDSMTLSSALLIDRSTIRHLTGADQTWSELKNLLH